MSISSYHGLLVIDKPTGMTSRDVVNRVQTWFPRGTRIGHTGTLDPLATGVLVLCIGLATRLTEYVQRMSKTYRAGLMFGATSTTDDADGPIVSSEVGVQPDSIRVAACLREFIGEIDQVPPAFSAARVSGRRAYALARRGEMVDLQPRRVAIYAIEIFSYDYPHLEIEVQCGKGTYIRSLARDLGNRLGCGALIETLRRTRVGQFTEAAALTLDTRAEQARLALLPLDAAVAELPHVQVDAELAARLRHGQVAPYRGVVDIATQEAEEATVAVFDQAENLVAVALLKNQETLLPVKVMPEMNAAS